ncbi:MAG TPA: DUF2066 domain-containing protein [Gammaproteobacteria bacterium]
MSRLLSERRRPRTDSPRLFGSAAAVLTLAIAALAAGPAGAVVYPNLYSVSVEPDPAVSASQAEAEAAAMRRLLVRITGNRNAPADPALQGMIEGASSFVQSYAYLGEQGAQVVFYPNLVDGELASLNQPVWGPERPLTLIWVAIDAGLGERMLLSANATEAEQSPETAELAERIRTTLQTAAEERGLPIALPLLDLEDLNRISVAEVWGVFDDEILAASARYGADAVLVGRVRVTAFGESVQWVLLRGDERRSFAGAGDVAEGLHWLADTFARDFSVLGGARPVRIVVHDVASFADYGRVMSYLEGLSALQTIDVESLDGDLLSLRASARGDVGVLERMLTLGRVLSLDEAAAGRGAAANTLVLRVAR